MTRHFAPLVLLVLLATACVGAAPTPSPSPPPTPSPSPTRSPSPTLGQGFYLRAWYTQALPPRHTFDWLPMLTVANGTLFDGNVAIPMFFPGPLTILPIARPISDAGVGAIMDEARRLGLLGDITDFTGGMPMPGARLGQLELVVEGQRYLLTGNPDALVRCGGARCIAAPGTPEAFAALWQELSMAATWLGAELGPTQDFAPDRIALLLTAATDQGMPALPAAWPFDTPISEAGVAFPGEAGDRCVTLSGEALAAIWPTLSSGNQLTVLVDQQGTQAALVVRVLVPGDESPCADGV